MPRDIVGRFATAGGVTDMDRVSQVEVLDHGGSIGRIVIHVVTVAHLRRAAMAAPVMGDDTIALVEEKEHLVVPVVGAQRPAVVEDDRLCGLRAPVFVVNLNAILGREGAHILWVLFGWCGLWVVAVARTPENPVGRCERGGAVLCFLDLCRLPHRRSLLSGGLLRLVEGLDDGGVVGRH